MKIEVEDIKHFFEERSIDANKYDFGVVGVMGGSLKFSGAIKLASMSALAMHSGAGIVRVIVAKDIADIVAPYLLEQTLWPLDDDLQEAINNLDVLALGMGWGISDQNVQYLKYILKNYQGKLIIDADGLNILANNLDLLKETKAQVILTPHLKEFSRLLNIDVAHIKHDPLKYAQKFVQKYPVVLLLKGSTTIVVDHNNTYLVVAGNPGMATAGSGDVLSGILAGFLGYNEYSALSVAAGAYLAGLAGSLASQKYTDIAMVAHNTIEFIPAAIKCIRGNHEKN